MPSILLSLLNRLRLDLFDPRARRETFSPPMQDILSRLIDKIDAAPIDPVPDHNVFMEEIVTADVYGKILAVLPGDGSYDYLEHPDAVLPDGTRTRKLLDLTDATLQRLAPYRRAFWREMKSVLTSRALQRAITSKFRHRLDEQYGTRWPQMVSVPLFFRDLPGYRIGIHPDARYKLATMHFYFPADASQLHLGTSFHIKDDTGFRLWKTNPFKPNSAYAFVRSDHSWHSVSRLGPHESARNSLALTVYQKGSEYKSDYDPSEK